MADCAAISSEPEAAWRAALTRDPFDPAALHGLGCALLARKRPAEAVAMLSAAIAASADAAILSDLGSALIAAGRIGEAEPRLRQAIALQPEFYPALFNLGGLLLSRDPAEAMTLLRRALIAGPPDGEAAVALASALLDQGNEFYRTGDMPRAERLYREAIGFKPGFAGGYVNLGNALTGQLCLPEALAAYRSALALDPANDNAGFAYGLCLLLSGDEQEGWRQYERRRGVAELQSNYGRRPELPQWQPNQSLVGKRVLLTAEQGSGDLIQFVRFAPALARTAAAVVLEMPWPLAPLLQALPGVERVIGMNDAAPDCEIACPLASLPLLLGPNAGMPPPYIAPPLDRQARWTAWLDRSPHGRRIGLVCSGDPRHPLDRTRSMALAEMTPLLAIRDASFVLVQTEIREIDRLTFDAAGNLRCPAAALTDYADTAALLSGLDLLISVDTSVAHLAGAMGLPVWTLLPYCPDYRWLLGRDDTPWYPSMRLYRQERPGDWEMVIQRVRQDLQF
jgi:tetratricopeptide (TPR) repeat protein